MNHVKVEKALNFSFTDHTLETNILIKSTLYVLQANFICKKYLQVYSLLLLANISDC